MSKINMKQPRFQPNTTKPVVINLKKKRSKRRKRYSRGLKDLQVTERRLTDISHRTTKSMSSGLAAYRKARNKSARKKRDGAIVDFVPNMGKGAGKTLRVAGPLAYDVARASYPKTAQRLVRRQVRLVSKAIRSPFRD